MSGTASAVDEPAGDERGADGARLAERAEADLVPDPADVRDHRVERDDRRALLARHDLVEVRLPDRARDAEARP